MQNSKCKNQNGIKPELPSKFSCCLIKHILPLNNIFGKYSFTLGIFLPTMLLGQNKRCRFQYLKTQFYNGFFMHCAAGG